MTKKSTRKIAIIGGGFTGICFAAHLAKRSSTEELEILIFDKSGVFGAGYAYCTPFPFHLLNVRAKEMSLFVDAPNHFIDWLQTNAHDYVDLPLQQVEDQFVPRLLYRYYLKTILNDLQTQHSNIILHLLPYEVKAAWPTKPWTLESSEQNFYVDEIVLATGNEAPDKLPFPVYETQVINNPWHYQKVAKIPNQDAVLIVGTGLSMIDAVLTLHHQNHQGKIYATSRRGLLPLPHSDSKSSGIQISPPPQSLSQLLKWLREWHQLYKHAGLDWQILMNQLRDNAANIWLRLTLRDKKIFLRHLLPYWNIHRHRVPQVIDDLLNSLKYTKQLQIIGGRIQKIANQKVYVRNRQSDAMQTFDVRWVVNCIGPQSTFNSPLYQQLFEQKLATPDKLNLGLEIKPTGALHSPLSTDIYTLGALRKGTLFASNAVPEIRLQCDSLAKHLLS